MAAPSLTHTLTNGTTADASEVMQNFNDLLNGITDGTKDLTVLNMIVKTALKTDSDLSAVIGSGDVRFTDIYAAEMSSGAKVSGWVNNLGMTLSGGTFTITDAGGTALSSTVPGYVTVPSTTVGQLVTLRITSGGTFIDDSGASNIIGELFGVTTSVAWAQDIPFFIYVANKSNSDIDGSDGNSVFFISRDPRMSTTPSSADKIGDTGAVSTDKDQDSIFILNDVTIADYTSLPCQVIGAIRMQMSSSDDWTVQAFGNSDGFGRAQLDKTFSTWYTMPAGQNGAVSGKYFTDNGGTAPTFTNNTYLYRIGDDGMVDLMINLNGDGGTDGAGAVDIQLTVPYVGYSFGEAQYGGVWGFVQHVSQEIQGGLAIDDGAATTFVRLPVDSGGTLNDDVTQLDNDQFASGNRIFAFQGQYRAY